MENNLVDIFSSWLTPILAIVVISTSILQIRIAVRKRKDDLFDKRYEFYKRLKRYWLVTKQTSEPLPDVTDLMPFASEASFLFGKDVSDHILSLEGKRCTSELIEDDELMKTFKKYLTLR